jgi:hypothetical protein
MCDGSHAAALLLSQALYWTPRAGPDGWFYKTTAQWEEELHLKKHAFENARDVLKARGFWTWKVKGVPPKCHYRVSITAIEEALRLSTPNGQVELHETGKLNCTRRANQTAQQRKNDLTETGKTYKEAENTAESTSEITSGDVALIQDALAPYGTPASQHQAEKLIQECRARVPDITPEEIGCFIRQKGRTARNANSPMGVILRTVPRDCITPEAVSEMRSRRAKEQARKQEEAQRQARYAEERERLLQETNDPNRLPRLAQQVRSELQDSNDPQRRKELTLWLSWYEKRQVKGTSEGVPAASNARGGR